MGKTIEKKKISPLQASYWKSQYEKQKHLVDSIISLLIKYGSSLDIEALHREYLLTIMGQFLTGDSCYYSVKENIGAFAPALSYGRIDRKSLPLLKSESVLISYIRDNRSPEQIPELPEHLLQDKSIEELLGYFAVMSPLFLKEKLLGIVFLGKKISSQPYTEADLSLLHSFCTVSAMTFNHAMLFQNAKLSIDELHKLNNIRMEIMSRITHEFRTPLTVIKSGLDALHLEDERTEIVQWIKDSLAKLENLIGSLLDLNENWENNSAPPFAPWDPVSALHESISAYSQAAAKRDILFEVKEIPIGVLPQLRITPKRFLYIANNLIDNAIKFSNDSTTIFLEFENTPREPNPEKDGIRLPDWKEQFKKRISEYTDTPNTDAMRELMDEATTSSMETGSACAGLPQQFVVFKVTDGGIGIPEGEIPYLSEPFQQASNSPNLGVKGKGLGLAVTQKILSRYGGHIYCKSVKESGTTFTIFLPLV